MTQAPATPELVERLKPDATPAFSGDGPHTVSPAPDSCSDDSCPDHDPKGFVGEPRWRCFHCEFATSDEDEALQHFGPHPIFDPACKMTDAGQRREYIALDAAYSQVCKANKEAAAALEAQQARIAELEAELADVAIPSPYCEICGSCGSEGCGCEHKCKYAHSHPDVVRDMDALQALADRFEKALRELVALVRGECPRLLDEDSGGNAALSIEIDEALSSQGRHAGGER